MPIVSNVSIWSNESSVSSFPSLQSFNLKKCANCIKCQNMFRLEHAQTCPNVFRLVQICLDLSHHVQTCLNMFRLVQTCSNLSKRIQTCPNMFRLASWRKFLQVEEILSTWRKGAVLFRAQMRQMISIGCLWTDLKNFSWAQSSWPKVYDIGHKCTLGDLWRGENLPKMIDFVELFIHPECNKSR